MPARPCLKCGALSNGSYCPKHKSTGKRGSTRAWRGLRQFVIARDGGQCTAVVNGARCSNKANLHVDHRYAKAKGGLDTTSNLQTLCAEHNLSKGKR